MRPEDINIILGCEQSQEVTAAFRKRGFNAMSCDLEHDGAMGLPHHNGDLIEFLKNKGGYFHCGIFFPPCTHLAVSGAAYFEQKKKDGRQKQAIDFFMYCINSDIKFTGVENPIGIMSTEYKKPDQIIQPYFFGDDEQKATCLWLKNLPKLVHTDKPNLFESEITHVKPYFIISKKSGKKYTRIHSLGSGHSKERSKTFPGVAAAMANQWGDYLLQKLS